MPIKLTPFKSKAIQAIKGGDDEALRALLAQGADHADLNSPSPSGMTLLTFACALGRGAAALALLKAGAKAHAKDGEGASPLKLALERRDVDLCRALMSHPLLDRGFGDEGGQPLPDHAARSLPPGPFQQAIESFNDASFLRGLCAAGSPLTRQCIAILDLAPDGGID